MSYRLKFRVWDKSINNWLNDTPGTHCFSEYYLDLFGRGIVRFDGSIWSDDSDFSYSKTTDTFYFEGGKLKKDDPYVIQQFTGLKDRNGKEIYEGDIVNFDYLIGEEWREKESTCGEVFFSNGIFYFDRDLLFATNDGNFDEKSLQVIGNIFENSELLK